MPFGSGTGSPNSLAVSSHRLTASLICFRGPLGYRRGRRIPEALALLSGEIPAELGNLANLTQMALSGNELSGAIPSELSNLSNLEGLSLPDNRLSGEIPPELSSLSNLDQLRLNNNELSGEIPSELGQLSNLESLVLSDNELRGCVPSSLQDRLIMAFSDLGGLPFCGAEPAPTTIELA